MKKILSRPYESEANYCSDSYITDKGTSISEDIIGDYSFQTPDYEFSDTFGFIDGNKLILVTGNYEEIIFESFRHDNTNNRVYLPDDNGGETWKEIVKSKPIIG